MGNFNRNCNTFFINRVAIAKSGEPSITLKFEAKDDYYQAKISQTRPISF